MKPNREELLFVLALNRVVRCLMASRKRIALGQCLEQPSQCQHAQRAVLRFHRAGVNTEPFWMMPSSNDLVRLDLLANTPKPTIITLQRQ